MSLSLVNADNKAAQEWRDNLVKWHPRIKDASTFLAHNKSVVAYRIRHNLVCFAIAALLPWEEVRDAASRLRDAAGPAISEGKAELAKSLREIAKGQSAQEYNTRMECNLMQELSNVLC